MAVFKTGNCSKHQLQYQLKIHLQPTTTMVNSKIISSVILVNSVENFRLRSKRSRKFQNSHLLSSFFCSYYTCCCASWCQLLSGSWFSESLLDFFLELINSSERIPHYFFCIVPLNIKICFNKSTQILIFFNEKIRNQCESIRIVLNPDQSSTSARGPRGRRGWNSRESEFERKPATNERWVELLTDFE